MNKSNVKRPVTTGIGKAKSPVTTGAENIYESRSDKDYIDRVNEFIATLKTDECGAISYRNSRIEGKIVVEIAEKIVNPYSASDNEVAGLVNNFSPNKARRCWIAGDREKFAETMQIKFPEIDEDEVAYLGVINPKMDDRFLRIKISEKTAPSTSQLKFCEDDMDETIKKFAKRAGKDGDFIGFEDENGDKNYVFSFTVPVLLSEQDSVVEHRWLKPMLLTDTDTTVDATASLEEHVE